MGRNYEIDMSRLEAMFQRLSPQNIQSFEGLAIEEALTELQKDTISILVSKLPNATKTGTTPNGVKTDAMTKGVKKTVDRHYATGTVHIMGDYRLKWFELGTNPRYTTGARNKFRSGDIKKTVSAGQYRGQIQPIHFFKEARENANIIEAYRQSLLMSIENAFNGQ